MSYESMKSETWNAVTGCTKISDACTRCYAERMALRMMRDGNERFANGFNVTLHPDSLLVPTKWKQPRRIFMNSMYDIFHDEIPFEYIKKIFDIVTTRANWHIYMFITKRPERMVEFYKWMGWLDQPPISNLWTGITTENQECLEERAPYILQIPSIIRFFNIEPILSDLALQPWLATGKIHWISTGGETGSPKARKANIEWVRNVRDQCKQYSIPFKFMHWGGPGEDQWEKELDGVEERGYPNTPEFGQLSLDI